ncbi:mannitol dehydrogenase family protein [Bacteroidota bacterium]
MKENYKLNKENLPLLPKEVMVPMYDRSSIKTGIIHIGVGNFHRAHQAFYTDQLLQDGNTEWGICGIGLLEADRKMYNTLKNQDGLYTLMVMEPGNKFSISVIGSIVEYLFAPDNPEAALEKMADPDVRIISLTITEGGYNFDSTTGDFIMNDTTIQWDLEHPDVPKTVYGYITRALQYRRDRGLPGLTILSCDNIQHNGNVCKKMLLSYVKEAESGLIHWIGDNCSFPNSMVDRITPATSQSDITRLMDQYRMEDNWPVTCEPFTQWVIEDDFTGGRPSWESVGAQFVRDVTPYEKMKIRLLNAGHSLLGFAGTLYGYETIDETVRDPLFEAFLREFMDKEVTPVLGKIEGINIGDYKDSLIERFSNPNIKDKLARICGESSAKIPKFLLPTIQEQLDRGGPVKYGALIVSMWCRFLELAGTSGYEYEIQDAMGKELQKAAIDSIDDDPFSFLKIKAVFGDLVRSERFVESYIQMINKLRINKIEKVVKDLIAYS